VGRAYRHAGRDYLQTHHDQHQPQHVSSVVLRQQWRQAKNIWTAIFVAGRAIITEQVWMQQEKRRRQKRQKRQKKE
jgi:hypothetical protein